MPLSTSVRFELLSLVKRLLVRQVLVVRQVFHQFRLLDSAQDFLPELSLLLK